MTEFWQRWHMTLSSWLRDYLYIPLGGNRKGPIRTYVNLIIVMLLSGLWHGANWTFILWGAWHGVIMAFERLFGNGKDTPYPRFAALPLTFIFVVIGWVTFRSPDFSVALKMYAGMFGMNGYGITDNSEWFISNLHVFTLIAAYIIIFAGSHILKPQSGEKNVQGAWINGLSSRKQVAIAILFTLGICKLIGAAYAPFLYFDF